MSNINHIKDAYRNGDSYAKIARDTGFDVKTVKKYIMQEDFSPKLPSVVSRSSILDPYKEIINSWLESDKRCLKELRGFLTYSFLTMLLALAKSLPMPSWNVTSLRDLEPIMAST